MTDMTEQKPQHPGYEQRDAGIRWVFVFLAGLFALMVVAMILMAGLFGFFEGRQPEPEAPDLGLAQTEAGPPEPRLQVQPELDWETFLAKQDSLVNSYGWVVKEAGIARIPVDRAMQMMLDRGFAVRPNSEAETPDSLELSPLRED